jgi:GTP-binding protein
MPVIAIVGRPNVGKSSLLNALVGKRISIVDDIPGVTRDRVAVPWQIDGRYVELVDTGGYGFVDPDQLTEHIKHQIELAMARANLVLFIVDCQDGLTSADEEIASLLRRQNIKSVLVANKADGPRADAMLGDFARLGVGTPVGVSALNDRNLGELAAIIAKNVDLSQAPTEIPEPEMHIAIVGKRNAGKSTLVNTIAEIYGGESDRVIVSEVPGTTRDSIDVRLEKEGHTLVVIDTAGVRKKRHMMTNDIEFYSFHRAQRSIRRADVVLLLIDATEPASEPDRKLAQYVAEQLKPVVLVVNKWDLAKQIIREQRQAGGKVPDDRQLMQEYREYLNAELRNLDYAPVAFVTATEGRNVQAVLDTAQRLFKQARLRISTGRLNQVIRRVLEERTPSTPSGNRPKIYYATQVETAPPSIVLVVNRPVLIDETYQRFMINRLRELLPYPEVPIRLLLRPRAQRTEGESLDESAAREKPGTHQERAVKKRRAEAKPRPKRATRKGPPRGTRPH